LELGIGAGSEETRMMRLSVGRKSFNVGLAVWYNTGAWHPASHPATLP